MKNKIVKTTLMLVAITLIVCGIIQMIKYEIIAIQGNLYQMKASTGGKLAAGEPDPSTYGYNINIGGFEAMSSNEYGIATFSGYQIYCINPASPLNYEYEIRYADAVAMVGETHESSCGCAEEPLVRK